MNRFTPFFLAATSSIAIVALIGRATHYPILCSWIPSAVAMKEATAWIIIEHTTAAYLLSFSDERRKFRQPCVIIAVLSFLLAFGVTREIFHMENLGSFDPRTSFFPSIMTVVACVLLSIRVLAALYCRSGWLAAICSELVTGVGLCAVLGYLFNAPCMYYFNPGYTTAMALPAAVAFLVLGLAHPARSLQAKI